jgi:hypothetical protein
MASAMGQILVEPSHSNHRSSLQIREHLMAEPVRKTALIERGRW